VLTVSGAPHHSRRFTDRAAPSLMGFALRVKLVAALRDEV
jgi:hypothetical protein